MLIFLLMTTIFLGCLYFWIYFREPRTLWLGISFFLFIGSALFLLATFLISVDQEAPLYIIAIVLALGLLLFPTVMIFTFLFNGVKVIKNEGFHFGNILALGFGIALFIYLTFWPIQEDLTNQTLLNSFYYFVSILVGYFLITLNLYTVTSLLNVWHLYKPKVDYLIVLGAGLNGDKVTPLLAERIDKAISLYRKNPNLRLIMTGGQGSDELVAEGVAMAQYAIEQGVPEASIIIEDKAINTEENVEFSINLMDTMDAKFAIVSNSYHVYRALIIAKEQGYKCSGYGAKTKFYFSINAFIREFIGYLYLKRKIYLIFLGVITILFLILNLLPTLLGYYVEYFVS